MISWFSFQTRKKVNEKHIRKTGRQIGKINNLRRGTRADTFSERTACSICQGKCKNKEINQV